jgi:hypothetical protein
MTPHLIILIASDSTVPINATIKIHLVF